MATYKEAYEKTLEYFKGDELAAGVFVGKYALTDNDGDIKELTPDDMHRRLAKEFARIEKKYPNSMSEELIYSLLKDFKYIVAQGSPMNAIGNNYQVQSSSNCFVIEPPYDSYGGILKTDQEEVQLMKRRGGVGTDVSNIRPRGLPTNNAAKTTDGIGIFLERFSNSCREVAQGGRRGALMLSISIHHPEIETFINIKKDKKKVTGANISIRLTDEFMNCVKNDTDYELRFPVESKNPSIKRNVSARAIWKQIIRAAWESAEPGLLYWDTAKKRTPSDIYSDFGFASTSTNPCGEIILSNYDSCRLMVLNLFSFVKYPFSENAYFDYDDFSEKTMIAQRLMDDLIDLELERIDEILKKIENDKEPTEVKRAEKNLWLNIRKACEDGRRTGLGITALGDTLAGLNVVYGSDESVKITENVYKTLGTMAYKSSIQMAKERGKFPIWSYELEKDHIFIKQMLDSLDEQTRKDYQRYGRRNIALTTTAPTGSVSVMTQTTSGIEPAFLLKYTRRKKINPDSKDVKVDFVDDLGDKWQEFTVYHHNFKKWMEVTGKTEIEDSPYYKATSNDVDWKKSVEIQAVAQKWLCHAVSKTCNIPNEATEELVDTVYMKAWESGCKGFTVYRDGCRSGVLVSQDKQDKNDFIQTTAPKRDKKMPCDIHRVTISGEAWTILVGLYKEKPYEVFGGLSKYVLIPKKYKTGAIIKTNKKRSNGGGVYELHYGEDEEDMNVVGDIIDVFDNPTHGAFTRTLSLALRHGAPVQYICEQLQKDEKDSDMYSFSRVIARVLKKYIADGTKSSDKICENCGAEGAVVYKEGCKTCASCGYSKC